MKLIENMARHIRLSALELCYIRRTSHIGGALSVADILAVLYGQLVYCNPEEPDMPERDRLFYSKGHAAAALYAALQHRGFFSAELLLKSFATDGTVFTSHINHQVPGVELSTGSLGHALGVACGSAVAALSRCQDHDIIAILSDGELDEGSNWEAILFAAHHRLDNMLLVIDYNKIQSFGSVHDVMQLDPLAAKFEAFNWEVCEVDGHDIGSLLSTLKRAKSARTGKPQCVIAHTIKGKGVDFMENQLAWHYRSPNDEQYREARRQIKTA